jgi:hypothetical protein
VRIRTAMPWRRWAWRNGREIEEGGGWSCAGPPAACGMPASAVKPASNCDCLNTVVSRTAYMRYQVIDNLLTLFYANAGCMTYRFFLLSHIFFRELYQKTTGWFIDNMRSGGRASEAGSTEASEVGNVTHEIHKPTSPLRSQGRRWLLLFICLMPRF